MVNSPLDLVGEQFGRTCKHTYFADDADANGTQDEPTTAEQNEQDEQHGQPEQSKQQATGQATQGQTPTLLFELVLFDLLPVASSVQVDRAAQLVQFARFEPLRFEATAV